MKTMLKSVLFLLFFIGLTHAQSPQNGLVAYYPFNGNSIDESDNGNNGIVYGATLTNDRFNNPNSAYYFDGINDYIRIADSDKLTPANNKLSIVLWTKTFDTGNKIFLYKGDNGYNREYFFSIVTGELANFGISNFGEQYGCFSESIIQDEIWYLLAGTWDGETLKMYVNGQLENSTFPPLTIGNYDSDLFIGTYGGDITKYAINAVIDDIRIYNRVLDESEIASMYPLHANFIADTTSGFDSLTVHFTDLSTSSDSTRSIKLWAWDFDNDGVVDSEEQNPVWTYKTYGDYSARLTVSDSIFSSTELKHDYIVINSKIIANFVSDIDSGLVPLRVQFSDSSTGYINSWQWDFNNDNIIDSYDQNPVYTFFKADTYTVKLITTNDVTSDTLIKENFITAFSGDTPNLYAIEDVPNDQGGWVMVKFAKSIYDTDSLVLNKNSNAELYTVEINDGSDWTAAVTTVAYGKSFYTVLTPTTSDSNFENSSVINFRVIAGMDEGNFVSNSASGYSVDNLKPSVPIYLTAIISESLDIVLNWSENREEDFKYYKIYRTEDGFSFAKIGETAENKFIDSNIQPEQNYSYSISAVDNSGNESDLSDFASVLISGFETSLIPANYYLSQNYPNPFNPVTTIKYGLQNQGNVRIIVYDVMGHEVIELINKNQNPGHHQVIWSGVNTKNEPAGSGIYYYKILTKDFTKVRKMLLLK